MIEWTRSRDSLRNRSDDLGSADVGPEGTEPEGEPGDVSFPEVEDA